jgi:phosphocarrier protein
MVSKTIIIKNPEGLHMRPAGVLASEMENFPCKVTIIHDGKRYNAKSLINIISARIKHSAEVIFECDGDLEEEALAKVDEIASQNFGD